MSVDFCVEISRSSSKSTTTPNEPLHFYRCCQFLTQFIFIRFCWGAALTQTAQTKLIFVKNLCEWILLFDWNFFSKNDDKRCTTSKCMTSIIITFHGWWLIFILSFVIRTEFIKKTSWILKWNMNWVWFFADLQKTSAFYRLWEWLFRDCEQPTTIQNVYH